MRAWDEPRRLLRLTLAIVTAITLARIAVLVASPLELYPDEAQYWWWGQSPDFGYFSKPPLIAWIIRASTLLFGDREWAIRLPIPLLHAGASLFLFGIARIGIPGRPQAAFWSAVAYLTLPGVSYSSALASTDAPLLFFWSAALWALLRALAEKGWRWPLACGLALGLGILAKYAMLFFVIGLAAAAVANRDVRRLVLSPRGLAMAVAAIVVVAPNIAWNASHDFATLAHTRTNADWSRAKFSVLHLVRFWAGQFGVFGPVLMVAWLLALRRLFRQPGPNAPTAVLIAMSVAPFALIAMQSFLSDANANWAATAYVAAVPLALHHMLDRWPRPLLWCSFALHGVILGLLWAVLLQPAIADELGFGNAFKREEGWRTLALTVFSQFGREPYDAIASENRSVTAELFYYLRKKHLPIRIWDPDTASHNHFEMTVRLMPGEGRILLVLEPDDVAQVVHTFESVRDLGTVSIPTGGRHLRVLSLFDAYNYRGPTSLQ